ncbi:hypothetical protein J3R82DRAFT_10376 [Butyriboletus roseoflavus]|nr:hypothetical protein J3R82DRAFT_10376 [Butyriboletus roseoflavus]
MLSNFRQRFLDPLVYRSPPHQEQQSLLSPTGSQADAFTFDTDYPDQTDDVVAQRHCTIAMAETEIDDDAGPGPTPSSYAHRMLPSTRSIVQVLYPPSYLGTPRPSPDPPSYSPSDFHARGDGAEVSPLISSPTTSIESEGIPPSRSRPDPLAQNPSLTGVPSPGTPSGRVPPAQLNPTVIASGGDVLEDTEPLPAYSRFDQRRPRFPVASDVLGPYPPLSILCQAAR